MCPLHACPLVLNVQNVLKVMNRLNKCFITESTLDQSTMDLIADLTEMLRDCLPCLGLIFVVKNCLGCLVNIYAGWRSYVLPKIVRLFRSDDFVERFGQWAVVTGCTGGIGREYALGLAKKGMSMVLVSRSRDKLEELEKEIVKLYKVKTMVIVADFTKIEAVDYIVGELKDSRLDIGVLVSNVGIPNLTSIHSWSSIARL